MSAIAHTINDTTSVYQLGFDRDGKRIAGGALAKALGFADGTWKEITDAEAVKLRQPTPEEKATAIRSQRDALISATDYLMMPDYPISDAVREEVRAYRQALRDVTKQGGFPDVVAWQDKPKVGG